MCVGAQRRFIACTLDVSAARHKPAAKPPSATPPPSSRPIIITQVIAYQGDAVDPEMAAVEKQLLKNYLPPGSKDNEEHGPPSFEWHILMEYCDRGSLSRALSNFM